MGIDSKSSSIKSLYREMLLALKCNDYSYSWLISKCKNQSLMASISRQSVGIESMTLNTFKKYADKEIKGGFSSINELRKNIYKKNNQELKINSKKDRQQEHQASLKKRLEEAERYRSVLVRAYNELNQITLDAIKNNPQYEYDYQRHKELYSEYFGLKMAVNNA